MPSSANTRRGSLPSGQNRMVVIMVPLWLREHPSLPKDPETQFFFAMSGTSSTRMPLLPQELSLAFLLTYRFLASEMVLPYVLSPVMAELMIRSVLTVS